MTVEQFIEDRAGLYADKESFQVPFDGSNKFYDDKRHAESLKDYASGLREGIELMGEFAEWVDNTPYKRDINGYWFDSTTLGWPNHSIYTTPELIELFLDHKNKEK